MRMKLFSSCFTFLERTGIGHWLIVLVLVLYVLLLHSRGVLLDKKNGQMEKKPKLSDILIGDEGELAN